MVLQDNLESPPGYMDDDETNALGQAGFLLMIQDSVQAFNGKLLAGEPGERPRLSELGHALVDFTAIAKRHGFSSEAAIAHHLSSVTWPCLMAIKKLAGSDRP